MVIIDIKQGRERGYLLPCGEEAALVELGRIFVDLGVHVGQERSEHDAIPLPDDRIAVVSGSKR